jgi:predicted acetyltransferase
MTIEIRPPVEDELRAAMEAAEGAFGSELEDHDWERERKILPPSRALAAYDGDKAVGLAAAYAFDLSIPGGELPCAGVTWVGVLPTHRRRGILRDFMQRQLEDVHGWGEPLAALWASEASIYGRFGYGAAVPGIVAKSNPRRFTLEHDPPSNLSVRLTNAEEAYRLFPSIYDRFRTGRAGMLSRSEPWWKELRLADPKEWRRGASQKFYAVAEVDGNAEGYTTYRVKDEWEEGFAKGEVRVVELFGTSSAVELELWRYLHSIDLTVKVDIFSLDPASALFLNVRDPRALGLRLADALWLRLVDLDAALKARSYKPGESIVLEVSDEVCPWNAGRYRVGDDAGRTEDTADLALDVADLAAAYLGAFDFHRLVHAGRASERRDGAAEAATLLFRTDLPPYCPEVF